MANLDLQTLGMRLGEAITPTPSNAPQVSYGTVDAVNADGTLDVELYGTTLRGLVATTGCVGAQVGMRCVVLRQGPLATVVGLVASTDLANLSVDKATFAGRVRELADLPVLWTGYSLVTDQQALPLAEKVSEQQHGIILAWSYYSDDTPQDYNFNYTVVPKWHVKAHTGCGVDCDLMATTIRGHKYVYVSDQSITGHAGNASTKTYAGVTNSNASFVLRAVLGF